MKKDKVVYKKIGVKKSFELLARGIAPNIFQYVEEIEEKKAANKARLKRMGFDRKGRVRK
jgi:hypothetical protein